MPVPESPIVDLLGALQQSVDRARADRKAERVEVLVCFAGTCDRPAHPKHTPCCSASLHGKALCCEHYCRSHFVEVNPCSPDSHAAAAAVSVSTSKD